MSRYLKRKIDKYLMEWYQNENKKPLIIKGARQVGKTRSILHFANSNYENVIEINFVAQPIYCQITENGYSPESILKNISRINPSLKINKGKTLIFFDEVQAFPDIVTSLKFFSLDGNYDVICSGSLLGIHYNEISSMCVGYSNEIELKSLDFEEFLWALGYDDSVKEDILEHMRTFKPFSEDVLKIYNDIFFDYCIVGGMPAVVLDYIDNNNYINCLDIQRQIIIGYEADIRKYAIGLDKSRISNVFRSIPFQLAKENKKFQISKVRDGAKYKDYRGSIEWLDVLKIYNDIFFDYCIVGGMPAVVLDYIDNNNYINCLDIQRQIIIGYEADIRKYAIGLDKSRISNVFRSIPFQLAKENKKFQISKVRDGAKYKDYRGSIEWLDDAGIINISKSVQSLDFPLKGNEIENSCVIYYADSGLLLSQLEDEAQMDFRQNKNFDIYKGGFFESIVGEALVKSGYELHYYKKSDSTLQEEFLVRSKDYLVPIEVKAGNNKSKSLTTLINNKNIDTIKFGIKVVRGNIGYQNSTITFPHFCAFLIKDFLASFEY